MFNKRLLWIVITLIAMLAWVVGCAQTTPTLMSTEAPSETGETAEAADEPQESGAERKLVIFHAGSLTVPVDDLAKAFQVEHPNVTFETEAGGSRTTARKVSELGRQADVVMSADYTVIDNLLLPDFADWNVRFARNTMVIAYTDEAKFADEITRDNWYEVLPREGVIYGHSEPDADPCGYRTLMVWQLAEAHYGVPGLYDKLDENCPPENVRPKSVELIALLESGDMDYAFEYRSVAVQHGLNFVELPEEINLSRVEYADFYSQATVELSGSEPGETIMMQGKPIVYGVTIPHNAPSPDLAQELVAFLLGPEGQAIMEKQGQPPIVPAVSANVDKLPDVLRDKVELAKPAAEETETSGPIEVVDALGRTLTFEAYPQRIVVPGKGSWMVGHPLYLFPNASERLLAMEKRRGTVSPFLSALDPTFDEKPHLETDAAPEQIAPLKPDAIVVKSYMQDRLGDPLEEIGLPVLYVELETPEQYFADLKMFGHLLGAPERAEVVIAFYQQRMERLRAKVAAMDEAAKPDVLVVQHITQGNEVALQVPPASWMQTILVQQAGGNPVWIDDIEGGGWTVVNLEQIAAWDPDKIFLVAFRADPSAVIEELKADPMWQELRAVQNGALYGFPADYYGWDVPDPRWILGMTWAATKLHPDAFADIDMRQEVYDFYGEMYGMDKAAVDEIIIPQLKGDVE